jgi:hypothetical protein
MEESRGANCDLWENPREKRPLEDLDVHGEVIKIVEVPWYVVK